MYTSYVRNYYPIKYVCVHGLCQSRKARLHSTCKDVTASDYTLHGKGVWQCKWVELHIITSAYVKIIRTQL